MSQLYLQRFEYRAAAKSEFDQAWTTALQTFAKSGNWGGAEAGVRHVKSYGTAWGGYVLIEVDDADSFARYQLHHSMNYGHMVQITFEPDAALEQGVRQARTQGDFLPRDADRSLVAGRRETGASGPTAM